MKGKLSVLLALLVMLTSRQLADQRYYVWTYEYKTMERGEAEIESYFTLSAPDLNNITGNMAAEHQVELEIGMTDRFDVGIYHVFNQEPNEALKYKKFKFRTRYRFGEKGKFVMDPLIYFEYISKPDFSEQKIEGKVILAKDVGRLNNALNSIFEFEKVDEWKFEVGYTIGSSYKLSDLLRIGIEVKGGESGHYIGPVITHGKEDLWVTLGSGFSISELDDDKPRFKVRLLLGIDIK